MLCKCDKGTSLNKSNHKPYNIDFLLQYAHSDELEKWRKDHLKAVWTLKELLDTAETKLNAPVQVSFLSVRSFLQDVEVSKSYCLIVFHMV